MSVTNITTHSSIVAGSTFMGPFAIDSNASSGLLLKFKPGTLVTGVVPTEVPARTISMTTNTTNWIYHNGTTIIKSIILPAGGNILYKIVTDADSITSIEDHRGAFPTNTMAFP